MMEIVWTIVIRYFAGLIAKMITPGKGPGGFFMTAVLGIAGSIGATYLGQALGLYPHGHPAGFFAAIIGAVILLVIYHLITKNNT